MSSNEEKKPQYSKKILKLLSQKSAINISEFSNLGPISSIKRSLKGLLENGLVESHNSGQNKYLRLTNAGRRKAHSLKLDSETNLLNLNWDKKWRIILLDLPEERKNEREALRYLLKKAGFILLKNSVWISPHPFEHLFMNIKKDLNLKTELMIFVTDIIDKETEEEFISLLNIENMNL